MLETPQIVVIRLPRYLRALYALLNQGMDVVSSEQLGSLLHMTPAQIRKDLSYFGRFGKQGKGYDISHLVKRLRSILGLNMTWNAALVGVGRLGHAIAEYPGFAPEGFHIVAALDKEPRLVGQTIGGLLVSPIDELCNVVRQLDIQIGIVAVPSQDAQQVVNEMVECGIMGILSYAPIALEAPKSVRIYSIDPVVALQAMTYYLQTTQRQPQAPNL